jgi:carbon-monoxide dehydrogenase medium subunit
MHPFDYHRPATVAEAVALLRERPEAKVLAGGQTLIPVLRQRLAAPSDLIDLGGIAGLAGIRVEGNAVTVGAMTTHQTVAESPEVARRLPALIRLAAAIGDLQVRNRGTVGGSLANNDPAADWPAAALALGAVLVTDRRQIAADDFFRGLFVTALEADEVLTAIRLPLPRRAAYAKFRQPASGYALAGVFVAETAAGVRVAATGAGSGVFRLPAMEAALGRHFAPEALDGVAVPAEGLNHDLHAAADYRAHLVGIMARQAVAACA